MNFNLDIIDKVRLIVGLIVIGLGIFFQSWAGLIGVILLLGLVGSVLGTNSCCKVEHRKQPVK